MRMTERFGVSTAFCAIFLVSLAASSGPAAAAEPQVAGFCVYFHENSIYYRTPVFRADKDKRSRWKTDWANHLYESGVKYYGGYGCRAWEGGADAVASAAEAAAKPPLYTQRIVELDWIPEDTFPASGNRNANPPKSTRLDSATPAEVPSANPVPSKPATASAKYIEVAGPNGTIRLSPEVAARNQAAADEYRRQMDEHARAQAEHDRKLAEHQQNIANAAAEKRDYERRLAMNDAQVAAHGAAMAQHAAGTRPSANGAKGWMYCEARGEIGSKRRFYSRIAEVDYVPGQISIIDVMARNRAAFKIYLSGTHKVFFATDSLLHCPYSTDDLAEAQSLEARDKRGDGNNGIEIIQTGWAPAS